MSGVKFSAKCAEMSFLLDELTSNPKNKYKTIGKFISYDFTSDEQELKQDVTTIFKKVVKNPESCSLYAELCFFQIYYEGKNHNGRRNFGKELAKQTQCLFKNEQEMIYEVFGAGGEEKYMEFRPWLMVFIGFLYRYNVFPLVIIIDCIVHLTQNTEHVTNNNLDQKSVLCELIIVDIVAYLDPKWRREKTELHVFLNHWLNRTYSLRDFLAKTNQLALADLLELKKNEWIRKNKYHFVKLVRAYSKIEDEVKDEKYHIVQRELKKYLQEKTEKDKTNIFDMEVMNSEIRKIRCEIVKGFKEDKDLEKLVCPIISLYADRE